MGLPKRKLFTKGRLCLDLRSLLLGSSELFHHLDDTNGM